MISSKKITVISIVLIAVALIFTVVFMLVPKSSLTGNTIGNVMYSELHTVTYTSDDYYTNSTDSSPVKIDFGADGVSGGSKNVAVDGNEITILGGGTYVLSGDFKGNVVVDSADKALVRLVMNGVNITSDDFSALYVKQAEKVVISLVAGTENCLCDGKVYNTQKQTEGKPTAALYSHDALTVNGEGALTVIGNYMDGIKANDELKITGGTIKVTAVDEGINANDYIALQSVSTEINSGGDGIRCENESSEKGFIALEGTGITVVSGGDGISASSSLYANSAKADISAGGGSASVSISLGGMGYPGGFGGQNDDTPSTKGIKASEILINGGTYIVDSADDAIHSDGSLSLAGGSFSISCGDDAIHGERNVVISPEILDISKCLEGIEGAYIVINSGDIRIVSGDDAINAVGENSAGGGRPMGMHKENITDEDVYLTINGGNIYIETGGDGVDSNGAAVLNGGTVQVYGPENGGNSSLDFEYGFVINGGKLIAAGSSGMAELPHNSSKQSSLVFYLTEYYGSGSAISVTDSDGNEIMSGVSNKKFNWVCVSDAKIVNGGSYKLTVGGAEVVTLEATDVVTSSGNNGRRMW